MQNGVPNRLTQVIVGNNSTNPFTNAPNPKIVRNLLPTSLYAQDQWTRNRLTLQRGVRWDLLVTNYPDSTICGPGYTAACTKEIVYPKDSTQGVKWDDVTPRVGVAFDVRQREDGVQVQHGQVYGSLLGDQYGPGPEPDHPDDDQHDANVDR